MPDTVFRSKIESTPDSPLPKGSDSSTGSVTTVEVPYLDYATEHSHPYLADHFTLGDNWNDPVGGFPKELATIETYINEKVESGEVANSVSAIKVLLKGIERITNLNKEERPLVKIETIAAYVQFLMKTDQLKTNLRRYHG